MPSAPVGAGNTLLLALHSVCKKNILLFQLTGEIIKSFTGYLINVLCLHEVIELLQVLLDPVNTKHMKDTVTVTTWLTATSLEDFMKAIISLRVE